MTLTCSKFRSEPKFKKIIYKYMYVVKYVFYKTYKHQLCYTFYEARRLFAMTNVLDSTCMSFGPTLDKFRIFDLSRISAFVKCIV